MSRKRQRARRFALIAWAVLTAVAIPAWLWAVRYMLHIVSPTFNLATSVIVAGFCGVIALALYWEREP